jgi:predicted metal-dependent phosphotriesterase family hydrolase
MTPAGAFVQTVLGPIAPGEVGPALIHEHLLIENPSFVEPAGDAERVLAYQPVGLANLGWIRRNWTSNMATPSDAQRLEFVRGLLDAGFGERILQSHDICTKHRLSAFGGHGFGHLTGAVVPWMHQRGFTSSDTATILVDNPARLLAVTPA